MGFPRQMKDMKQTVEAAPGLIGDVQALDAQAQQMGIAQQAAAQVQAEQTAAAAAAAGVSTSGPGRMEPIAGVSLQQFAVVSKGLAAHNYDVAKAPIVAAQHGISAESWETAQAGWNGRITADPSIAQAFNAAYRSV
ncbi:MAG: hypothetical protein Q7T55_10630 [Solirubrobacteraceae bacterium]|nr:hypothetical protein [Solirubrobacteraceae bacterium]